MGTRTHGRVYFDPNGPSYIGKEDDGTFALKFNGVSLLTATAAGVLASAALGAQVPAADDTYDLGSASVQWRSAYIDGTAFIDKLQLGDTAIDGLLAGAGTSAAPYELGATAGTALDFRFRSSHTAGDARGMYLRLDLDAAAVGAEALRAFTEIEDVAVGVGGTINGAHITMEIDGDTGNISGAGQVIRATLGGSGTKTLTGTLAGVNLHLDLPTAVTLPADLPALRLTKTQDHEWPVFASFDGIVGSGNAIQTSAVAPTGNTTHALRIKIDGTDGFIPVYAAAAFGN